MVAAWTVEVLFVGRTAVKSAVLERDGNMPAAGFGAYVIDWQARASVGVFRMTSVFPWKFLKRPR